MDRKRSFYPFAFFCGSATYTLQVSYGNITKNNMLYTYSYTDIQQRLMIILFSTLHSSFYSYSYNHSFRKGVNI
jgi:hypothetical protein